MVGFKLHLGEIIQILAPHFSLPHPSTSIQGVAVDSRLLKPGDLFFALPGAKVDGHSFLAEVEQKKACAAVVSKSFFQSCTTDLPLIPVDDVLQALQILASTCLQRYSRAKIVAITGSMGKTSTKHLTDQLLKTKLKVSASPSNHNSQIGLQLTLLNHVQGNEDVIVLEMGMTGPGQIAQLVSIAPPDIALLTAIDWVHAQRFESLEEIAACKGEIFSHPHTALGIIPHEVPCANLFQSIGNSAKITYSNKASAAHFYLEIQPDGFFIRHLTENSPKLPLLPFLGRHNYHNFLAAATISRSLGIEWELIQELIPKLTLPDRRLEQIVKKGILFINDSYNAAVAPIKAALDSVPSPSNSSGKKVAVLGEMAEMGKMSEAGHNELGTYSLEKVDYMICLGEGCRPIETVWKNAQKPVYLATTKQQVIEELQRCANSGDVVLLKGSNSAQLWEILKFF